jgi:hypothetical protein
MPLYFHIAFSAFEAFIISWNGLFRVDRSPCDVLSAIVSQLSPPRALTLKFVIAKDIASGLEADDHRLARDSPLRTTHRDLCLISGFRCEVDEGCAFPGYNAASCGNFLLTFRGSLSVPSSRIKNP